MDMNNDIVTLTKKGLKTRPYNIGMEKKGLKKYDYDIDMNKRDLKKLTKKQLIKLLLKQQAQKPRNSVNENEDIIQPPEQFRDTYKPIPRKSVKEHEDIIQPPEQFRDTYKPIPPPRTGKWESVKPKPVPRKSVKQMVNEYEDIILPPPKQFRDRPPKPTRKPSPVPKVEENITNVPVPKIKELNRALKGHAKSYEIELQDNLNPLNHFTKTRPQTESHLEDLLKTMKGFKFIETLEVTFEKDTIDSKTGKRVSIYKTAFFNGKAKTITKVDDIEPELSMSRQEILNVIGKWVSEGSGWVIDRIDSHYLNVTLYKPLNGSNYIKLSAKLGNSRKGLINLKNEDNECFRWCHIRHLNPQRIKKYYKKKVNELNYDGVEFPVSQRHYNKVEKQNSIRINVFGYEDGQPFPINISKETFEDQMNLLLITKDEKKHYVLIKDFNAFVYNQSKHKERKHFCMYCLQCFSSIEILDAHRKDCIVINGKQAIKMPNEDENRVEFINHRKQIPVPFVIYADFEAITKKNKKSDVNESKDNSNVSYTKAYQTHIDCGYGYKVVCHYDWKLSKVSKIYRGKGAVYKFLENMLEEVEYRKRMVKKHFNKNLRMMDEDMDDFNRSNKCYICNENYAEGVKPMKDHCRITGRYLGSAHDACCSKLRMNPDKIRVPVIFHNLRGYDNHLIMQQIGKIAKDKSYVDKNGEKKNLKINAIPNNMERYMAFTLGNNLTFIDSFQFMSSSLDKLVSNLRKEDLKYTSAAFYGYKLDLMSKKGIYRYDFMDSMEKLEIKKLPKIEDFYSTLNEEHISEKDYNHAKEVWNAFRIKNVGEYHDLYLQSDVLLLTDVFENFRNTCMQYYGLDPCHYFTSPGLSWDAMLKMTNVKLELMTDINMYQFIEKGMRGVVSYIANRYGKANNKYMEGYDEKKPKYLLYLDANNLYGWAMSQYLPYGSFKWLSDEELNKIDLGKYKEDSREGLVLEVYFEYPNDLHELQNDYPLAPEKVKVSKDMLSEYCNKISEKYKISFGLVNKLIPTLNNKKEYVVHYRNVQLYMDLGLKVTKVHRALKFKQSPWLKQYIDFNTNKRKEAKTSFQKGLF